MTEVNLARFVNRLIRGRGTWALFTLVGLLLGLAAAYLSHPYYIAYAVFMPPPRDVATASPVSLLAREEPTDMYLGMLGCRTVADDIIDHLQLMKVYKTSDRSAARNILGVSSNFWVNKNALITVSAKTEDPKLSAAIANAYLDALYRLNGSMASSGYRHRQQFFEEQLESQKDALSEAEVALRHTQETSRIVLPEGVAMAGLSATAQLQAEIGAAETRLAELRLGATEDNPIVIQARTRLEQLRSQLARQQNSSASAQVPGIASTAKLPALTLEYARKAREVKLQENVYDALTGQYQRARIAASDPGPQFQVVDQAVIPEHKAGPSRKTLVGGTSLAGFVLGFLYVLLAQPVYRNARSVWFQARSVSGTVNP